jgi:DNA-binding MarR family transcriptional regulator
MSSPKKKPAISPARAREVLRLDRQLCFALYRASGQMTRSYRDLLEPLGLTYPQYLVMMTLWERAPRTVNDIGAALDLDSGTLTPLLNRLESSQYVMRRRDKEDARRVQIHLTAAGERLRLEAAKVPLAFLDRLNTPLPELIELLRGVKQLSENMASHQRASDAESSN